VHFIEGRSVNPRFDNYRDELEALLGGPLPEALVAEWAHCAATEDNAPLDGLFQTAELLEAVGDTYGNDLEAIDLEETIMARLASASDVPPLFLDGDKVARYLDDCLTHAERKALYDELEQWPHLAEELAQLRELKNGLGHLAPSMRRQLPKIDILAEVTAKAKALDAEEAQALMDEELDSLGLELEALGDELAQMTPPVDLVKEVMGAVEAQRKTESGAAAAGSVVPFPKSASPVRRNHKGPAWSSWAAMAASLLFVAGLGLYVVLGGGDRVRERMASQPTLKNAPLSTDSSGDPFGSVENDFPDLVDGPVSITTAEVTPEPPGPRSRARNKNTTWDDVLAARRSAVTDKSALEKLQQWASLSREEILDLLEEGGLDPEVIAGAAQFLPPDEAIALLQDLVNKFPDDPYLRFALAKNLAAAGDNDLAREHLDNWAQLEPGNGLPRYMEANLRFSEGDVTGGLDALYMASAAQYANPYSAAAALDREAALIAAGYDRDTARFLSALTAGANEGQELSQLGRDMSYHARALADSGDFQNAEQVYLGMYNLGQQLSGGAQTTNDFASGISLQRDGLAALSGLYSLFGVSNPDLLSQLTAEVVTGLNQLNSMLNQLNAVIDSADLALINNLLNLIMQGAELSFFGG